MLRVLLFLVPLALAIYALVDCISSKDEEIKHLPKLVWIALIVLAWVIGPLAWIFVGRKRGGRLTRRGGTGGGWVAPDDNPEFLRSLNEGRGPVPADKPEDPDEELRQHGERGDEEEPPGGGKS